MISPFETTFSKIQFTTWHELNSNIRSQKLLASLEEYTELLMQSMLDITSLILPTSDSLLCLILVENRQCLICIRLWLLLAMKCLINLWNYSAAFRLSSRPSLKGARDQSVDSRRSASRVVSTKATRCSVKRWRGRGHYHWLQCDFGRPTETGRLCERVCMVQCDSVDRSIESLCASILRLVVCQTVSGHDKSLK